jgi:hypothetical protein
MPVNTSVDGLLSRLEDLTAEAAKATNPALHELVDTLAALELIGRRGALINELSSALSSFIEPLSYTDYNRLIVIHFQGRQAESNLISYRNQLANLLSTNTRERTLLDRITGIVETPHLPELNSNG